MTCDEAFYGLLLVIIVAVLLWFVFKVGEMHATSTAWEKDLEQAKQDAHIRALAAETAARLIQTHIDHHHKGGE